MPSESSCFKLLPMFKARLVKVLLIEDESITIVSKVSKI